VVAAIGTAVGLGMYWATAVAGSIALLSLWGLRLVRGRIRRAAGIGRERLTIRLTSEGVLDETLDFCRSRGYRVRALETERTEAGIEARVEFERLQPGEPLDVLLRRLGARDGVLGVDRDEP
jgi:uncharacterized membrane protein YhiD involved in acid resistance